jgi:hypothetical protein
MVLKALAARAMAALACAACSPVRSPELAVPSTAVVGTTGELVNLRRLVEGARVTVLVFFSRHCCCLDVHEDRLRTLYADSHPRGVQLFTIDSEVGASREGDDVESARRAYPFPILVDPGGRLADALGAEYATYSLVLDADGRVRYRGGIDTDKTHLRADATPHLRNAIDDLLAGRAPRVTSEKAMGCALEKR